MGISMDLLKVVPWLRRIWCKSLGMTYVQAQADDQRLSEGHKAWAEPQLMPRVDQYANNRYLRMRTIRRFDVL